MLVKLQLERKRFAPGDGKSVSALLLQVASATDRMTLAWPVGKKVFLRRLLRLLESSAQSLCSSSCVRDEKPLPTRSVHPRKQMPSSFEKWMNTVLKLGPEFKWWLQMQFLCFQRLLSAFAGDQVTLKGLREGA